MFTENKLGWRNFRVIRMLEFLTCSLKRGYPRELAKNILAEVKFSSRNEALQNKRKTSRIVKIFIQIMNMIMLSKQDLYSG